MADPVNPDLFAVEHNKEGRVPLKTMSPTWQANLLSRIQRVIDKPPELWATGDIIGLLRESFDYLRSAVPNAFVTLPIVRHVVRGSQYKVIGPATLQTEQPLGDEAKLIVYRDEKSGSMYARFEPEMFDGRFVQIEEPHSNGRMLQIEKLIADMQEIQGKFGNTCVYIRRGGMAWGAAALNYRSDDERNGVFDIIAAADRNATARIGQIERLIAERNDYRHRVWKLQELLKNLKIYAGGDILAIKAADIANLVSVCQTEFNDDGVAVERSGRAMTEEITRAANVNDMISVKLTDHGIKLAANYKLDMPDCDADGWRDYALWSFFQQFGPYMAMGGELVIETEFRIKSVPAPNEPLGFTIRDGQRQRYRSWTNAGPGWCDSERDALKLLTRADAEQLCEADEDAWYITPVGE